MSSVDFGRWKFVSSRSTTRKRNPGITKSVVSPDPASTPAAVAADSSARKGVVPTAGTRPPTRPVEPRMDGTGAFEPQSPEPLVARDDRCARAIGQLQRSTDGGGMARAQLHPRLVVRHDSLHQHLDLAAGGFTRQYARLDHARVVEDDEIAFAQLRRKIGECEVGNPCAIDVQQTAARSR